MIWLTVEYRSKHLLLIKRVSVTGSRQWTSHWTMISLKLLLLFPVIVNILKKISIFSTIQFFFLFPIFFTTKSVLTDFRLYLPNQPKSSIGYPTRPVWSRFLYQWETIIAHKTQLPCGHSQSSLSVFKFF